MSCMTPDDHYRAAEQILDETKTGDPNASYYVGKMLRAQVHATLATVDRNEPVQ